MKRRAVFLDRDGVINVEKNYCHQIGDFEFTDGIFEALRHFQAQGLLLVVVTNQAGIGRGLYTEADFAKLTAWMLERLEERGIRLAQVYYCPYHPEYGVGKYRADAFCRKPNPGMILQAARDWEIDLATSLLVGDKESDVEAGVRAGIPFTILVRPDAAAAPTKAAFVVSDVKELLKIHI